MVVTDSDPQDIHDTKQYLHEYFEMKDLGSLRFFLDIEVNYQYASLFISQIKYASDLLIRAGVIDNKTADIPLELNLKLRPIDGKILTDSSRYRQLVDSFNSLTIIWSDISHAVHVISQFIAESRSVHYASILQILRYIKGTLYCGLLFFSFDLTLCAYSNADWTGDVTHHRSTIGYCIFFRHSPIA
uniref:Uncharacterized protein LOC109506711 n=1 Tax=Elaeis guineensis var. tenera TaxID=51953 RepID=A0A6J0PS33_ELAGV|nr:uncharacterized protein LOC109506711 [Elaeis guineensis]